MLSMSSSSVFRLGNISLMSIEGCFISTSVVIEQSGILKNNYKVVLIPSYYYLPYVLNFFIKCYIVSLIKFYYMF